jgi:hypothetical protein
MRIQASGKEDSGFAQHALPGFHWKRIEGISGRVESVFCVPSWGYQGEKGPAGGIAGGGFEILQLGGSQEEVQKKSQLGTTQ